MLPRPMRFVLREPHGHETRNTKLCLYTTCLEVRAHESRASAALLSLEKLLELRSGDTRGGGPCPDRSRARLRVEHGAVNVEPARQRACVGVGG